MQMSQQKFASNVVEKCLTLGSPEEHQLLVDEMLGTTNENEPLQVCTTFTECLEEVHYGNIICLWKLPWCCWLCNMSRICQVCVLSWFSDLCFCTCHHCYNLHIEYVPLYMQSFEKDSYNIDDIDVVRNEWASHLRSLIM